MILAWLSLPFGAMAMRQATAPTDPPIDCAARHAEWVDDSEISRRLATRAISIIEAAGHRDSARLGGFVSPAFTFLLTRGDTERDGPPGVAGAIALADLLQASRFERDSSISMVSSDICGRRDVTLRILKADGTHGHEVHFRFERGVLVRAEGRDIEIIRGSLGRSTP